MENEELERAIKVFNSLCGALDARKWHYEKDEERLRTECTVNGEDIPLNLTVWIEAKSQLVVLFSYLPFIVPEEKRVEAAMAVSVANNGLIDGSFDYNIKDGRILFRMTSSFLESEIGSELIDYMIAVSLHTVDDYNDRFLMLLKGLMSIEEFIAKEKSGGE